MLTVDANVWVAAADPSDEFYAVSRTFLMGVARRRLRIYISPRLPGSRLPVRLPVGGGVRRQARCWPMRWWTLLMWCMCH